VEVHYVVQGRSVGLLTIRALILDLGLALVATVEQRQRVLLQNRIVEMLFLVQDLVIHHELNNVILEVVIAIRVYVA